MGNLPRVVAAISYYRYFIVSVCDLDWQFHCQKSLKFVIYCAVYRKAFRHIGGARNQRGLQNSFGLTLILKSRKTFLLSKVRVCVNPSAFIEHLCKFPFIWSSTSQLTEYWHLFFYQTHYVSITFWKKANIANLWTHPQRPWSYELHNNHDYTDGIISLHFADFST